MSQEQYLRALQALRAARDLALGHVEVRVLSDVVETVSSIFGCVLLLLQLLKLP